LDFLEEFWRAIVFALFGKAEWRICQRALGNLSHGITVRSPFFEMRRKVVEGKDGGVKVAHFSRLALGFLRGAVSREVEQIGRSSLLPSTF
jgi:hypothetical protein